MKRIGLLLMAATLFISVNAAKPEEPKNPTAPTQVEEVETSAQPIEMSKATKDSILYQKLSADQLLELTKKEMEVEKQRIESDNYRDMPFNSFQLLLICALPFLFAGTIIVVNVRQKNIESKRKYDLYTKSIEMGQTIPEHFFDEPKKENTASNLKRGIIWLFIGLGVVVSLILIDQKQGLILGIVPAFVGAGYLLVHFLDKPKSDSTAE